MKIRDFLTLVPIDTLQGARYSKIHTSYVIESTYELLKVFEYRMVGRASKELINQMAMIVPRIIQRDTFGFSG